jgi:serine protease Do
MGAVVVRIVLRHLSGSRATEVDEIAIGAHREVVLGRAPSAAVRFDPRRDPSVGRHHARIECDAESDTFRLVDLDSRNGTLLNGRPLTSPACLVDGDVVGLGPDGPRLEFRLERIPVTAGPVARPAPGRSPRP